MPSRRLLRLTKDINIPTRAIRRIRRVVPTTMSSQRRNLGNLISGELDLLEVVLDAGLSDALGDDGVAADLGPGENDVGACDGAAETFGGGFGDGFDFGAGDEEGFADHVVAEGLFMIVSICLGGGVGEGMGHTE